MKDIVNSDRGPKPIGPYSQGVKINGLLYLSGQIPLDPKTNEMICRRHSSRKPNASSKISKAFSKPRDRIFITW